MRGCAGFTMNRGYRFDSDTHSATHLTIPLPAVWAIVSLVAVGAFISAGVLFSINSKLDATWTINDQIQYAQEAQRLNINYKAPDPWDIRRKTRP